MESYNRGMGKITRWGKTCPNSASVMKQPNEGFQVF